MKTQFTLRIEPTDAPLLNKKCSRCSSETYYCSKKFRVNANKKNIDVWMIYKCINCDHTYNICILEREKIEKISENLYKNFLNNDMKTIFKYVFSAEIIDKNKFIIDYDRFECILLDVVSLKSITNSNSEFINIKIETQYTIQIKLSNIVRKFMNISSEQFRRMADNEVISVPGVDNTKNCKIKNGSIIRINTAGLKNTLPALNI